MFAIRTSGSETSPEQKQPSPKKQKLGDDDDNKVKLFPFKGVEIEQQFQMSHEDSLSYNKQVKESGVRVCVYIYIYYNIYKLNFMQFFFLIS